MTEYVMKYNSSNILRIYKDGKDITPKSHEDYEMFEPKAIQEALLQTIHIGIREFGIIRKPKIKSVEVKVTTTK